MGNAASQSESTNDAKPGKGSIQTNMLRLMRDDVFEKYEVMEVLGTGSLGFVAEARIKDKKLGGSAMQKKKVLNIPVGAKKVTDRRETPVSYAIKSIKKDRISASFYEEFRNETEILRTMDHPNIVKAYEFFQNKRQLYMVLEICSGGDLYTRAPYSEQEAAGIFGKLLSAIKYMHDHGIVHRDLKFENIMFEDEAVDAEIKLIDFGLSKKFLYGERDLMNDGVGTVYTMAPQVLQGVYTSQADLWSMGVILFMLLSSQKPFTGATRRDMIASIMDARFQMTGTNWEPVSQEAKDLVSKLIELDPSQRLTATSAGTHEWLSSEFKLSDRKPDAAIEARVKDALATYTTTTQLKKIALNVIAHRSTTSEILELRKCFDQYDISNDGVITAAEFKTAMERSNYSADVIDDMFATIDVNQTGHIHYTEFLAASLEGQNQIEQERIAEAFDRLDADDTGKISKANLMAFLGQEAIASDVEKILDEIDNNKDGEISFKEFSKMFAKASEAARKTLRRPTVERGYSDLLRVKIPGGAAFV